MTEHERQIHGRPAQPRPTYAEVEAAFHRVVVPFFLEMGFVWPDEEDERGVVSLRESILREDE